MLRLLNPAFITSEWLFSIGKKGAKIRSNNPEGLVRHRKLNFVLPSQDWRQTCLPEGLSVAFACCEALRTAQQVDDPQRCSRERSDRLQRRAEGLGNDNRKIMIKVKTIGQILPFKNGTALPSPSQAPCSAQPFISF